MSQRIKKVNELLRQIAAMYFQRHIEKTPMVTVTRASASNDLKHATIFVTVYPEDDEEKGLQNAKAEQPGLQEAIGDRLETKHTPSVEIELDQGEKKRQRIDEILRNT